MTYGDTALSRPFAATKVLCRGWLVDRLVIALIYESQCGGAGIGIAPLLFLKGLLVAVYSLACHVISGALIRQPWRHRVEDIDANNVHLRIVGTIRLISWISSIIIDHSRFLLSLRLQNQIATSSNQWMLLLYGPSFWRTFPFIDFIIISLLPCWSGMMSPRNLSSSGKNNIKFKSDHFAPRWLTTAIERGRGEVMKLSRLIIIIVPLLPPTYLSPG